MAALRLRPWAIPAMVVGIVVLAAVLLWPSTLSLIAEWQDTDETTYTHGLLVVAIALWLPFRRGAAAEEAVVAPRYRAAMLVAAGSFLWLVTLKAGIQIAHQALLPLLLWGALHAAIGPAAKRHAFAIAFLYFAIPVWSLGNQVLLEATVMAVRLLLQISNASVYVDGNFVYLAAGTFEIADGCSGLHFFIVALALAALHGELQGDSPRTRLLLLVMGAGLAVLANWVRVFTIIMAGYLTDMQHFLIQVDHYYFGWVVFAVAMAAFFFLAGRLPARSDAAQSPTDSHAPLPQLQAKRLAPAVCVALLALGLGPLWGLAASRLAAGATAVALQIEENPGQWSGPHPYEGDWHPVFASADEAAQSVYRTGSTSVATYVASYRAQRQGKELIGYANSVLGRDPPQVLAGRAQRQVEGRAVAELKVGEDGAAQSLIWYYYLVGSRSTTSGLIAQLTYGLESLVAPTLSSVIAYRTDCVPDCETARRVLADFAATAALQLSTPSNEPLLPHGSTR